MNRRTVPLALAAVVTSMVATVVPVTAAQAALPPGASTGRCDNLPTPAPERVNGAEVQFRLNSLGETLEIDGGVGPLTSAALNRWATSRKRPVPAKWTPAEVSAALPALRAQTDGRYTLVADKDRQQVRVRRNGVLAGAFMTSTGHGQYYRGKTRSGEEYITRALTRSGTYRTGRTQKGWYESPLGCLFEPIFLDRKQGNGSYSLTGIALHGSMTVTGSPASAGCVRLHLATAAALHRILPSDAKVTIQGAHPPARNRPSDV